MNIIIYQEQTENREVMVGTRIIFIKCESFTK